MRTPLTILVSLVAVRMFGAGLVNGTLSPVGGNGTGTNFNNSQLTTLTNIINSIAPTNSGLTAAQVAAQIQVTNTTILSNTYVAQVSGSGSNNTFGTMTELNGAYKQLWFSNGGYLRTNTASPFDWEYKAPGGTWYSGLSSTTNKVLAPDGSITATNSTFESKQMVFDQNIRNGGSTFSVDILGNVTGTSFTGAINGGNITSGTLPISAADSSWMSVTNAIAGTNQPMTIGQALVVVGTNANGATMVKGTNWPTGGGGSVPNGLVTNNADADIVVTHLGNSTTIYATSPPSIETGIGTFGVYVTITNVGVSIQLQSVTAADGSAELTVGGNTNNVTANTTLLVTNVSANKITAIPASGSGSNYMGGTSTITNIWTSTNTAPTSVTVGTTAPDKWIEVRDLVGNLYKMPVWTNH